MFFGTSKTEKKLGSNIWGLWVLNPQHSIYSTQDETLNYISFVVSVFLIAGLVMNGFHACYRILITIKCNENDHVAV